MDALWLALQESDFAALVRNSVLLYPAANVIHVLAVLAFFAAVAAMDLSLLRVFGFVPARLVIGRLRPVALVLFLVIAATGFTLFSAEAVAIARNPAFQFKVAAIVLGLANVAVNEWGLRSLGPGAGLVRLSAGLSLALWLFTAAMGRMIAYL